MEIHSALSLGPARARVARILRDDLPLVLRFHRAAVFLPGPSGRPRLLASTGDESTAADERPSRLRSALVAPSEAGRPEIGPRTVRFGPDGAEPPGEALVAPLAFGGALVVYRAGARWTPDEVKNAVATARFVARTLAWSAVFAT